MAEAAHPGKTDCQDKAQEIECAVCLQRCVHPAQLPCGHIFCYLCVKGFANQNKKCAMCRQEIPIDFLEQPHLLEAPAPLEDTEGFDGGFQWFYGGRNGWWKYDERANMEIEEAYKLKIPSFELIICGELYVVDFKDNHQYPKKDPSRKRPITRDKIENVIIKGVAGWWQYDERTSKDLESAYKRNEKTCELLIAGFLYIIDLENMLQVRRNDPSRRRRIKRDYHTIPKKGIAGLPTLEQIGNTKYGDSESDNNEAAEQIPEISPETLTSDENSENTLPDLEDTLQRLDMLSLNNSNQNDQS